MVGEGRRVMELVRREGGEMSRVGGGRWVGGQCGGVGSMGRSRVVEERFVDGGGLERG